MDLSRIQVDLVGIESGDDDISLGGAMMMTRGRKRILQNSDKNL